MDAINVMPQPSPAALFTLVAPVAAGKTGVAIAVSPSADSAFAELFAKVAVPVPETGIVKAATIPEAEVVAGAEPEKEGVETEVASPASDLAQVFATPVLTPLVAVAVPVTMQPPAEPIPATAGDAAKVQIRDAITLAAPAVQLPVGQQPEAQAGPVVSLPVEPSAQKHLVDLAGAAVLPQQKAGIQDLSLTVPQKAEPAQPDSAGLSAPRAAAAQAVVTVAAKNDPAVTLETALPEQVQPVSVPAVEEPAVPVATVTVAASAVPEPVEVAVTLTQRTEDTPKHEKGETVEPGRAPAALAPSPAETVTAEPGRLTEEATVLATVGQAQAKPVPLRGKADHAMPEVAAEKPAVASKEAGTIGEKEPTVMKAASEKAAFNAESGDKGAKSGNEEKSGSGVSHNSLMGESVKTAAVESVHKADGGRSATAENVLAQVKETLALHNPKEAKQITMTLNPAELGELKINVSLDGQQLKVHVVAENAMVRDVLLANLDTLKDSLAKQNVTIERFNVSTGGGYTFNQPSGEEKWVPQRSSHQSYAAMGGMLADGEEQKIGYLTGTGNGLVDVRF